MQKILNLTMHPASPAQLAEGVVEPANKAAVKKLLLFNTLLTREEIEERAKQLAQIAVGDGKPVSNNIHGVIDIHSPISPEFKVAMIGGAPYLMSAFESALFAQGIEPVYAFSIRESVENSKTGEKRSVFVHKGFVTS